MFPTCKWSLAPGMVAAVRVATNHCGMAPSEGYIEFSCSHSVPDCWVLIELACLLYASPSHNVVLGQRYVSSAGAIKAATCMIAQYGKPNRDFTNYTRVDFLLKMLPICISLCIPLQVVIASEGISE